MCIGSCLMGRWIKPKESSTRPYRIFPGLRWVWLLTSVSLSLLYFEIIEINSCLLSLCVCVCVCLGGCDCSNECKFAFLQICVHGMCVTSGFVHGRSAAVPWASAGVCRSYDREGTPTPTAFRGTGYTTGGLKTCVHTHSVMKTLMRTHIVSVWNCCASVMFLKMGVKLFFRLCILLYFHRKPPALCFSTRYSQ